ncbi:glycosyltransferase [Patescibacteria group bacterium]
MKIALINSLYKPYKRGGAEVVFENIVKELKKDGHDVFVITLSAKKEKKQPVISQMDDVNVYRFYPKNIFSFIDIDSQSIYKRLLWHVIDTFNYHSYRQVKKILKKEKPELVITHNLKGLGYLIPRAIRKSKIKHIHTLHDVQLVNPSGLIYKDEEEQHLLYKLYAIICARLFASPQVVVSPSKWLMNFYKQYGFFKKSKEVVLANPLILDQKEFCKKFQGKEVNYLFLGQLEKHKGILFLIEVFKIFNKLDNCKLLVVGSGSLEDTLRKKYEKDDWIEFLGYVPYNQLCSMVFKRVHYTVLPSLCYENAPGVIYDSFKYATPVIASDIGGISELVQEGVNGYTFAPGNKFSLLNKLNFSLQNLDNFQQMSENAKIKAEDYNIKNYVYKILSL